MFSGATGHSSPAPCPTHPALCPQRFTHRGPESPTLQSCDEAPHPGNLVRKPRAPPVVLVRPASTSSTLCRSSDAFSTSLQPFCSGVCPTPLESLLLWVTSFMLSLRGIITLNIQPKLERLPAPLTPHTNRSSLAQNLRGLRH